MDPFYLDFIGVSFDFGDRFITSLITQDKNGALRLTNGLEAFYMADLIQTLLNSFHNPLHLNT